MLCKSRSWDLCNEKNATCLSKWKKCNLFDQVEKMQLGQTSDCAATYPCNCKHREKLCCCANISSIYKCFFLLIILKCIETSKMEVRYSHGSLRIFFGKKKEQRNCARGSQRIVLNILKTLEFKSGTGSLKS